MRGEERKFKNLRRDKIAETEITRETMVEIVVLVRDLVFAGVVRMFAFVLGELGDNVFEGMNRLENNRRKNRQQQCKV